MPARNRSLVAGKDHCCASTIRISVCMATFNGERFLEEQVRSILSQLGPRDELIVVDDHSQDTSREIVASFQDERIRLYTNGANLGPVRAFERALTLAEGDVIFFSDQDDIWLDGKIVHTVDVLKRSGKTAVVTDAEVVDERGARLMPSYFAYRNSAPGVFHNFYKNSYVGCCMAIDARMKATVLPFPPTIAQHDEWIGWVCDFVGEVEFLPRPLLAYRRHGANATAMSHSRWRMILRYRLGLLWGIAGRFAALVVARRRWRQRRNTGVHRRPNASDGAFLA